MAQVASGEGRVILTVPLALNGTITEAIAVPSGMRPVAIQFPAGLDATAMNFLGSVDNSTFVELEDPDGTEIAVVVAASKYVLLPDVRGVPYLKFEFGTTQDPAINLSVVFENAGPSTYWHSAAVLAAT